MRGNDTTRVKIEIDSSVQGHIEAEFEAKEDVLTHLLDLILKNSGFFD